MKRLIFILLSSLLLLLSGCGREPDKTFLVSAVCFENKEGKILVTAEYISVSDTDVKEGYTAKTASIEAEGVSAAVSRLSGDMTKVLSFSHCAVVMLGKNLTAQNTRDVLSFLKNEEISLSATLVCVDDASVLNAETDSNLSTGYALVSLLKSRGELFGYGTHTKIYEISTARKQKTNIFAIPYVTLKEKKLSADGMMLYLDDTPRLKLDTKESIYYAMARNVYEGGMIEIEDRVEKQKATKIKEKEQEKDNLTLSSNIESEEIKNELEAFINEMQRKGIYLFSSHGFKNIKIEGESPD